MFQIQTTDLSFVFGNVHRRLTNGTSNKNKLHNGETSLSILQYTNQSSETEQLAVNQQMPDVQSVQATQQVHRYKGIISKFFHHRNFGFIRRYCSHQSQRMAFVLLSQTKFHIRKNR